MSEQLSFDLPARAALGREDYFVSSANALAVALIDALHNWPNQKLILTGPKGAGKTHLASVWAQQSGARIIAARDVADADIPALATGPIAVEDIDVIADDHRAQTALFHLHNLAAAEGQPLLMTARAAPQRVPYTLPDLASRLQAAQIAEIGAPDDALLSALLMKLFADRQINPAPDVIPYLAKRIDRSFAAAQDVVSRLDRASLDRGKSLTRAFAASVSGVQSGSGQDAP